MQLGIDSHIPDGLLAANALLAENSRQGFGAWSGTVHQGFGVVISHTSLGIKGSLYDGGIGSRYTGKERDTESGNDYFGARYYASSMGRFMSPDFNDTDDDPEPVPYADFENPQSLNLYSYVRNNPLSRRDESGHMTCNCPPDYTEAANQLGWLIELYFANVRRGFPLLVKQYFGKSTPAVPTTSAPAQSTPADPNGQDQKGKNKITKKIRKQMARRGWTDESIDQTTSHPVHTSPTENLATGNAATAYFNADGSYVVVDNVTEEVVQVSNRLDPNWVPDSRIVSPYKP